MQAMNHGGGDVGQDVVNHGYLRCVLCVLFRDQAIRDQDTMNLILAMPDVIATETRKDPDPLYCQKGLATDQAEMMPRKADDLHDDKSFSAMSMNCW